MVEKRQERVEVQPAELLRSPLYSQNCQEALKVMERLAAATLRNRGAAPNLSTLAAETGMSVPALAQVVHFLQRSGLVKPRPATGGVQLARTAEKISMLDVVRAIDGEGLWNRCLLGLAQCSDEAPCPAHSVWKKARRMLERHLDSQSIADLARAVIEKGRRRRPGVAGDGVSPRRPNS